MKNNKIKILTLSLCAPTAIGALTAIASCSKPSTPVTPETTYNVTVNASTRYVVEEGKVGKNKATRGQTYSLKFTLADNFKIDISDIIVKIGDTQITDFAFENNTLTIPANKVTNNITITVTPTVINLFDIDSTTHQLQGFVYGLTNQEILNTCKGTLTIPRSVVTIAPYAFYDEETEASTIPEGINNLVFEESLTPVQDETTQKWTSITGYSCLSDTGEFNAIGAYAFKNAPFKSIKLPIGMGYTVGVSAFEGCQNITSLQMPQPEYVTTDEEVTTYGVEKGDWKIAACFKDDLTFKANWYASHKTYLNTKAFFDCKNLIYVSFSILTDFVSGSSSHFTIADEAGNEQSSNLTVLDLSNYCQLTFYAENDETKSQALQKWTTDFKDLSESSIINIYGNFDVLIDQLNWQTVGSCDKALYVLLNDSFNQQGQTSEQLSYVNNKLLAKLGYEPRSSDPFGQLDDKPNTFLVRSINNLYREKTAPQDDFDKLELTSSTATINPTSTAADRVQTIKIDDKDVLKDYGLKGNLEFEITKAEWTTGTEVPLTLHHVIKSEMPEGQQDTYKNNLFTILWEEGNAPKAGDVVKLTFNINCVDVCRETKDLELTITFNN